MFAQRNLEDPLVPNPHKFSLGVGVGLATMYGDLDQHIPCVGERIGIGRHITNSFLIGTEFYTGELSSKETPNNWTTGISSRSRFYSVDLNIKVNFSVFFSNKESVLSKLLDGFYIGSGIGYLNVTILNISEIMKTTKPKDTILKKAIKRHDEQPYIPLNIGLRIPLKNFLGTHSTKIMINYNMCYTYSDFIDGYNLSKIGARINNKFNDVYSVLTAGLSFSLGVNRDSFRWLRHKNNVAKKYSK